MFDTIHEKAHAAGVAAAESCQPTPMGVTDGVQNWIVEDGPCGFAWIDFAGNTAWGRWAKKQGLARVGYPKGLVMWVSEYEQSMLRKEAYAWAFAKVLEENGIEAHAGSRMD